VDYPFEGDYFFRSIFNSSPIAMIVVDDQGIIRLANREADRLFGYPYDQLLGECIEMLVPQDVQVKHQMDRTVFNQNPEVRPMGAGRYLRAVRRDGLEFPVEVGLTPIYLSDRLYILSSVVDLTYQKQIEERVFKLAIELEEANKELSQLARTDELTGLKNRRAFDEGLTNMIQLMDRVASTLSLLLIDVDHFKPYNDELGHPAGDELLKTIADLLMHNSRESDMVARYGGDEFAVLMPGTNANGAIRMGERIRLAVQDNPWEGNMPTISLGVATISFKKRKAENPVEIGARLLSDADQALYYSKNNGRNKLTHIVEIKNNK
jgi:diguanylate cyclase (GGDEF)-like protein/PAS domain S-box-containing protein